MISYDPYQLKFPEAGMFELRMFVSQKSTSPDRKDICIAVDPEIAKKIFDNGYGYSPKKKTKLGKNGSFYFNFKPAFLVEKLCIRFFISWYEWGVPRHEEIWIEVTLKNPFTPLYYSGMTEERGIAERQEYMHDFTRFIEDNYPSISMPLMQGRSRQPLLFISGPPGIGKTTFLEQWRRLYIAQASKNSQPVPVILIVRPEMILPLDLPGFAYEVNKEIYSSIMKSATSYLSLLPSRRHQKVLQETLEDHDPLLDGSKIDYEADLSFYHDSFVKKFMGWLENLLIQEPFCDQSGNVASRNILIFDIDQFNDWNVKYIGWLMKYVHINAISPKFDIMIIVTLRYSLKSFMNYAHGDAGGHAIDRLFSRVRLSPPNFDLQPLNTRQIRTIIEKRIPQEWTSRWWNDALIRYLRALTGGIPQAVESVLYHWWEEVVKKTESKDSFICSEPLLESRIKVIEQETKLLTRLKTSEKEAYLRTYIEKGERFSKHSRRSIWSLWDRYKEIFTGKKQEKIITYLYALSLFRKDILSNPAEWSLQRMDWLSRLSDDELDQEVIDDLMNFKVIEEVVDRGLKSYRLVIPVLCVPIRYDKEMIHK